MGSCLSNESRSPRPSTPRAIRTRRNSKRRLVDSRSSSFDYYRGEEQLHRTPGRKFLNGSSEQASLFTQQGKKGTNQDAMIVWENFVSRTDTVFCGVFDGHGPYGHLVAKRVRDLLPLILSSHWGVDSKSDRPLTEDNLIPTGSSVSSGLELIGSEQMGKDTKHFETLKESFFKACKLMDRELRVHSNIDCFCSGTTAVTLVKQGQDILIGNIGDSRAVLGTRDDNGSLTAFQLTVDLKPNLPAEEARIRKCKGRVFALEDEPEVARVWLPHNDSPGLAMARAFGDFCLKDFGLISIPEISYKLVTDRDEFVVLATDGVWDALSNEEVVEIVGSVPTRSYAARAVVHSAVKAWRSRYPTSKVDDCAVVCLFLDPNEPFASSSSSSTQSKVENIFSAKDDDCSNPLAGPIGLDRSGTVRTVSNTTTEHEGGVYHVNTVMTNMPRFEDDVKKAEATITKSRK